MLTQHSTRWPIGPRLPHSASDVQEPHAVAHGSAARVSPLPEKRGGALPAAARLHRPSPQKEKINAVDR